MPAADFSRGRTLAEARHRSRRTRGSCSSDSISAYDDSQVVPQPDTHVLVDLLRERDFYHASAALRGERQRSKRQLLGAQRYAEIALLQQKGWRICCVSEHLWSRGLSDDSDASRTNKE